MPPPCPGPFMRIAKVIGSAVATIKSDSLQGSTLLIVSEALPDGTPSGSGIVAVDTIGAGEGELVLISQGSAGRQTGSSRLRV
ncbi:Propanediol utilization protein PduN [Propionibacterium freudenreichii]|nr:Propanediol utilization protein PduN [Propionibacterium freudenreichii]CEI47927.1 Propanediol utilization protein PduN [Propionibacterium freudenreichii]